MKKGDIILLSSKSLISRLISMGEELADKDTFEPSHVALIEDKTWIWESTIGGVQRSKLKKYRKKGTTIFLASNSLFTQDERDRIIAHAKVLKGRGYGYLDLFVYLGDILLEKLGFPRNTLTEKLNRADRLVCSELVARCYASVGYHFLDAKRWPLHASDVRPDDIWRTVVLKPTWRVERIW